MLTHNAYKNPVVRVTVRTNAPRAGYHHGSPTHQASRGSPVPDVPGARRRMSRWQKPREHPTRPIFCAAMRWGDPENHAAAWRIAVGAGCSAHRFHCDA